jgi:hypothetical protein
MAHTRRSPNSDSEEEFNELLSKLLDFAHKSGIDVEGSWPCPPNSDRPPYDVELVKMERENS